MAEEMTSLLHACANDRSDALNLNLSMIGMTSFIFILVLIQTQFKHPIKNVAPS